MAISKPHIHGVPPMWLSAEAFECADIASSLVDEGIHRSAVVGTAE